MHTKMTEESRRAVIAQARSRVKPTPEQAERAEKLADSILSRIKEETARYREITGMELGGSYKKDTWLARPKMDIDVYVVFELGTDPGRFEDIAISVGYGALKGYAPYKRFSEHPYVEARIDENALVNIVPCYNVKKGEWASSADRSRFHTAYMNGKLTDDMRDDVRLLKAFLTANGLYGAQIAKRGFSGYVTEVLIAHYGSFEAVIREFAKIRPGTVIGKAAKEFGSAISIIDPIDENRNLAAAISDENLAKFMLSCIAFERRPSIKFFEAHKTEGETVHKRWKNVLTIRFRFERRAPDTIWGQTAKAILKIVNHLERGGFVVIRYKAHINTEENTGYLFVLLNATTIQPTYVQEGPSFAIPDGLESYIQKNFADAGMMWVNPQGRLTALKNRTHTEAVPYVESMLESDKTALPERLTEAPNVWAGRDRMDDVTAVDIAGELIRTDAAIVRLS